MAITLVSDYSSIDQNIDTAIDTSFVLFRGKQSLSFSEMNTGLQPVINGGGWVEVNGQLYKNDTETSISTTDPYTSTTIDTNTLYIMLGEESGTLNAYFTNTAPTWSNEKQGWYGSGSYTLYRYVAWMKYERGLFLGKRILLGNNNQLFGQIFKYDEVWTNQSEAQSNAWQDVTYGNGLYVAVSSGGTSRVMTSPDGENWTSRSAASASGWSGVTYGGGTFVAVSTSGTVMTSTDGLTWTSRTAAQANAWRSVTYGNGLFAAVSSAGTSRVMTSPDGINWTSRTAATADFWQKVTFGNGLFAAISPTGTNRIMTSPDGITWTSRTPDANFWTSITYGNGLFVAVSQDGTNRVSSSPDGITWTAQTAAAAYAWQAVIYGNGVFVALGQDGSLDFAVMTSPDGITWTSRTAIGGDNDIRTTGATYGSNLFVSVALSSNIDRVNISYYGVY